MAIEKTIEINVNAQEALKELTKLGKQFEEDYQNADNLTAEIGALEDALYEMARSGKQGTKEFNALSAEVGRMKKVIIDTDMVVDGMSQTLAQNLGGALGGITSAFELGAGAMGAMGVESEKVEEALLKVQSAMAIAQGVQGIRESVSSFKALGVAIRSSAVAQKVLNVAMKANPIGLIITAITALIAGIVALISNFKAVTDWLGITDDEAEKLHANNVERAQEFIKIQEKRVEAVKKEADEIGRRYDFEISKARAAGKETFLLEQEKRKQIIKSTQLEIKSIQDVIKARIASFQVQYGLSEEQAKIALSQNKAIQELIGRINELRINVEESQREIEVSEIEHQKKLEDTRKAAGDKRKEREAKEAEERLKKQREAEEISSRILNEFILHAQKSRQAQELELLTLGNEEKLNANQNFWAAVVEGNKKKSEEELQQERELQSAKLELAGATLQGIGSLVNAFAGENEEQQRRAFNISKAISIAQATIDTYKGATAAFASTAASPLGISNPAAPFIAAAAAVAAGLANVATIARQQYQGGGSGGAGGGAGASNPPAELSNPATFNVVGNTGTNQLAQTLGQQPLQAYVVAGDVTSAQSLERNKIQQSTL